jgi:cytochrome bd ubiquinol oxidase subunit II
MLYVVIFFLLVSVYLYCLLGGADFGAGIIELTASRKSKERVRKQVTGAIAPIWEANHIWLIVAVVILFNGFPPVYTSISIALYIPLILLLLGIVFRGTAFTFRHYDAIKDNAQEVYSVIFSYSSIIVTFFFGLIVGAMVSGKILLEPSGFFEGYIYPWFNLFSISVGLFLITLFAFIASIYLISEFTDDETRREFVRKSRFANIAAVIAGAFVFISSYIEGVGFTQKFFSHPVSIALIILSTAILPLLWMFINKKKTWLARIATGAQLLFILGAFYAVYYPVIIVFGDAEDMSLLNTAAPEITHVYLGWALIIGSLLIFPSLFYLYKVFKTNGIGKSFT